MKNYTVQITLRDRDTDEREQYLVTVRASKDRSWDALTIAQALPHRAHTTIVNTVIIK